MNGVAPFSSSRHFFVVNPVCFNNHLEMEVVIKEIHLFFNSLKSSVSLQLPEYSIHISRFPRDAIGAIQRFANAVSSEIPLRVYAVGGRGTLFDCLNGVVELENVELGIIPYKKGIDSYCVFGIKNKGIFDSLEIQTHASSTLMDVLYCGSNYALCRCFVGLKALDNARNMKKKSRWVSAIFSAFNIDSIHLTSIIHPELLRQNYRIWVDVEDLSGRYAFINISNGPSYERNNKQAIHEADPADGWLNVLACSEINMLESYSALNKYLNGGGHIKYPQMFTYRQAKKVFLSSTHPLILDLDGEVFYDKYISVEIIPQRVRVIAPSQMCQE
jgi:diacylglycerol kinase family enzyme